MKRLLKIKEFVQLTNRDAEAASIESNRPAKRPRVASKGTYQDSTACTDAEEYLILSGAHDKFLKVFESEIAKDIIWWLPGRSQEAFAMNKERFEKELLEIHFQDRSFSDFLQELDLWGYRHRNIPSLSGRILSFEISSKGILGRRVGKSDKSKRKNSGTNGQQHRPAATTLRGSILNGLSLSSQELIGEQAITLANLQLQQNQYLVQQEISQTYFSLLWQELQRQLSSTLLQQTQLTAVTPPNEQGHQRQSGAVPSPSRSTVADVAALLHQQQVHQQLVDATFYHSAIAHPLGLSDENVVVQELNDLHQQQLNNLTYQIVALVSANAELDNPPSPEQLLEPSLLQNVLVKYMMALVLLQLQQQQQNFEYLRQDRLTALALIRSLRRSIPTIGATGEGSIAPPDQVVVQPVSSPQMQQLLSEAAMLSLTRAHHLLSEASIISPLLALQPALVAAPAALHTTPLGYQHPDQLLLPREQQLADTGGVIMAPSPAIPLPPPRATAAR